MNKEFKLKEIEGIQDYSAIKKLAEALWKQRSLYCGAAIIIGSGFSRSAAKNADTNKRMPLWQDLSLALAEDLDAKDNTNALRLAEEYLAYFGKQALYDLIKKEIDDDAWSPGDIHESLLQLPWSEVLTTNWDTLLERAAQEVHEPLYSVVSSQEELASAVAPRIVKLHGTINVTSDLVFTQEDYRIYPQKNAAFVNFARQVFIENELCMLGFSGDDPNFLQWTGWVRDNLATDARRIYLVGPLQLTAAKRKYLESINIAPIDLWELVASYDDRDQKHEKAMEIFLDALTSLKPMQPWEWVPTQLRKHIDSTEALNKKDQDPSYAVALLERQIPILVSDHSSYPGWLICPNDVRQYIQAQLSELHLSHINLCHLTSDNRAKLLYEIAWRHSIVFQASPSWLIQEFLEICNPAKPCVLKKKQQMEIALHVLRNARWCSKVENMPDQNIEDLATEILISNTRYWPESVDELRFHQALTAREQFNYPAIEQIVKDISESEPVYKLRKAALLAEIGKSDEGAALITKAYRELLKHYRNSQNSVYIFSRLAWAECLLRYAQISNTVFPAKYKEKKCDPFESIDYVKAETSSKLEKQQNRQGIEPLFEPGYYKDKKDIVIFCNDIHPLLPFEGISNCTGTQLRWGHANFLGSLASKLLDLEDVDNIYRFSLSVRTANSDTDSALKKVFSRIQVACISQEEVDFLFNNCMNAIKYWEVKLSTGTSDQQRQAKERLKVFIEVFSRVLVRVTPEHAKEAFHFAMRLGRNKGLQSLLFFHPLQHLIDYALKSTPESQHHELLLDALQFPLENELDTKAGTNWPNPVINRPGKRSQNSALDRRIDEIIDQTAPSSSVCSSALLRLLPLIECDFLSACEKQKIACNFWGNPPDYKIPTNFGILYHALFYLPSQDRRASNTFIRKSLFAANDAALYDQDLLRAIVSAACEDKIGEYPDQKQATEYFKRFISWRPQVDINDFIGLSNKKEEKIGAWIGKALANSIVPSLPADAITKENFEVLYSFYSEVESPATLNALVYFAQIDENLSKKIEKNISQSLQDKDHDKVAYSAFALLTWRGLTATEAITKLISKLIYLIESGRTIGLSALLNTARHMYQKDYLSKDDSDVLTDSIPLVFDSAHYNLIDDTSPEAVSVSCIREECVKLARDILSKTHKENAELLRVLEDARNDPLPEVRFANC